jgi:hypothetical protein
MHLSAFDSLLWATGTAGQMILLFVLFYRDRAREFPVFTVLVGWSCASSLALYLLYEHAGHTAYYYAYWTSGMVDMSIQFAVVYEIASRVFAPLGSWAPDVRNSFIRLVGGSVLVALLLIILASPVRSSIVETVVARGTFFSAALMTELFVGLVMLSATAGLPWKTHVARITQALGAYSLLCVILDTLTTWMRWEHEGNLMHTISQVRVVAYNAALAYWVLMLWRDAPEPRQMPESMRMQIYHLQRQVEYDLGRIRGWRKI